MRNLISLFLLITTVCCCKNELFQVYLIGFYRYRFGQPCIIPRPSRASCYHIVGVRIATMQPRVITWLHFSEVVIGSVEPTMSFVPKNVAKLHKKLQIRCPKMQKSHKMKRICSLFRSIVYSIKEKLLSLRSEFHLRRKESLKFSRRQETSTFPSLYA